MNEEPAPRSRAARFSLLNLLALTALVAVGTAVVSAYLHHREIKQQRDDLLSLSSQLQVEAADELASAEMPRVAADFRSWNVHVPLGQSYELRLGTGEFSENGIPPIVDGVSLSAGRHRVTLCSEDSSNEEYRYVVYVDGELAIDKTMGRDWVPGGWSSATGINWPSSKLPKPEPLHLTGRSYTPRHEFGNGNGRYFNGRGDGDVTRKGYRLWIDAAGRTYQQDSPFMGFEGTPTFEGIGLRDGVRYSQLGPAPYEWEFTRPSLETTNAVLRASATFFRSDGTTLLSESRSFQRWKLGNNSQVGEKLDGQRDPPQSNYSAFLSPQLTSGELPRPVMELKWDEARPNEVALRLADTPANDEISRWQLRLVGGAEHLWRELRIGDETIEAGKAADAKGATAAGDTINLDLGKGEAGVVRLGWQTDKTVPLQIVERTQTKYAGLGLYQGLPVTFGIQIPSALKPAVSTRVLEKVEGSPGTAFPGGAVFGELIIDLDAAQREWIWLEAKPMEEAPPDSSGS